jgi:hypothetical protein
LPASGLWQILGTAKSTIGISGIFWIGAILGIPAIGAAVYEAQAARRAQTSLAAATQEYESQSERLRSLNLTTSEADQNQTPRAANADATGMPTAGLRTTSPDPYAVGQKFLARFPRARAFLTDLGKSEAARKYAPFFRQENLTADQIEQFESLIAATWVAHVVMTPTGIQAGVMNPTEDQISQLFGDQVAQSYESYVQTQYAYQSAGLVATTLGEAGTPLSSGQTDQLAQVIETNSSFYQDSRAMDKNAVSFLGFDASVDWNSVGMQAKAVLSPAQWEAAQGQLLDAEVKGSLFHARQIQEQAKTNPR